jgi:NAD(P)-dependent dehydrogenase (short-subunit alcohol dehydrogenase family)
VVPGRLAGHVVIVTGAAQGLGAAYARRLADEGCRLVVADLQGDKLAALREEIEAEGGEVESVVGDLTEQSAVADLLNSTVGRFGRLDGLVNNAAIYFGLKPIDSDKLDRVRWDRTMSVNVWGTFLCSALAARVMSEQGRGRIVNVASSVAYTGPPRMADYVASKGAVISLSRGLAREFGPFGVTVNVIAPGGTWTESARELFGAADETADPNTIRANQISRQSIPRQQLPEDVTGTVCFLLSDDSEMITGQVLMVDGGETFA